jgi:hypothetical protein
MTSKVLTYIRHGRVDELLLVVEALLLERIRQRARVRQDRDVRNIQITHALPKQKQSSRKTQVNPSPRYTRDPPPFDALLKHSISRIDRAGDVVLSIPGVKPNK